MIEAHQIQKSFGRVRAVRGISLSIHAGQVTALLGPNGAGKTTTIRMIAGTLAPDAGSVRIAGQPGPADKPSLRGRIGYLPEHASPYPEMTADEYLRYRARLCGVPRRRRKAAVDRAAGQTGIGSMRRRPIGKLSKGYRQRVGLAATLIHDPEILILDEPTNGLDPTQLGDIRALIRRLAEDHTVLVCSHVLGEVEKVCDRALVIAGGRLVADVGTAADAPRGVYAECGIPGPSTADDLAARLRARGGVVTTEPGSAGRVRYRIGGVPRAQIAADLHDAGAVVFELRDDRPDLEAVFMRAVEHAEDGGTP